MKTIIIIIFFVIAGYIAFEFYATENKTKKLNTAIMDTIKSNTIASDQGCTSKLIEAFKTNFPDKEILFTNTASNECRISYLEQPFLTLTEHDFLVSIQKGVVDIKYSNQEL